MYISSEDWRRFKDRLSAVNKKAKEEMVAWIQKNGFGDRAAMIDFAYGLATKYGEGAAALSAEMYDAIAELERAMVPPAVMADTAPYGEVAKAVVGTAKHQNPETVGDAVARLVKRTGADTTLLNAERDGAQFAWVPQGDTCAFCVALASRGWQYMSKNALKSGHAEHIHANCDCTYAVRFDSKSGVAGYDPEEYLKEYEASGGTPAEKINAMRRRFYAENKDAINEQKRAAYAKRKERQENHS